MIRLFCLDNPQGQTLVNNAIQLGTGEGKSVILAVSASIFAILGFDVDIVCYSKYLTERDSKIFKGLFEDLEISKNIKYGTYDTLSEDLI